MATVPPGRDENENRPLLRLGLTISGLCVADGDKLSPRDILKNEGPALVNYPSQKRHGLSESRRVGVAEQVGAIAAGFLDGHAPAPAADLFVVAA